MVSRMELTYGEIEKKLDVKYIPTSLTGHTLPPGIYELSDISLTLKSLFPDEVKGKITIGDVR